MTGKPALSVRVNLANGGRFGPGKAALMEAVQREGSIRKAALSLAMSYPRALKLIDEMNTDFSAPVIASSHGGAARGGSELTDTGQAVLDLYRAIQARSDASCAELLTALTGLQTLK